jgi:hypothetical protein
MNELIAILLKFTNGGTYEMGWVESCKYKKCVFLFSQRGVMEIKLSFGIGQYYALSHTIAGKARMKASDSRPAAPGNPKLLVNITGKEKV